MIGAFESLATNLCLESKVFCLHSTTVNQLPLFSYTGTGWQTQGQQHWLPTSSVLFPGCCHILHLPGLLRAQHGGGGASSRGPTTCLTAFIQAAA